MARAPVEEAFQSWENGTPGKKTQAQGFVLPLPSPPPPRLGSKGCTLVLSVVSNSLHPCLSGSWGFVASGRCMADGTVPGMGWKGWKESCPQLHTRLAWLIPPTPGLTSVIGLGLGDGCLCPSHAAFSPLQFSWQVNFRAEYCLPRSVWPAEPPQLVTFRTLDSWMLRCVPL